MFDHFVEALRSQNDIDNSLEKDGACLRLKGPLNRLVYAPTGPQNRDYDDVRRYYDAAFNGIQKALKVGMKSPFLVVVESKYFQHCKLAALLGALQALYVPIEVSMVLDFHKFYDGK